MQKVGRRANNGGTIQAGLTGTCMHAACVGKPEARCMCAVTRTHAMLAARAEYIWRGSAVDLGHNVRDHTTFCRMRAKPPQRELQQQSNSSAARTPATANATGAGTRARMMQGNARQRKAKQSVDVPGFFCVGLGGCCEGHGREGRNKCMHAETSPYSSHHHDGANEKEGSGLVW